MPALLPVLAWLIVIFGLFRRSGSLRESIVFATIPVSFFLVLATEGLSAFEELNRVAVAICWVVFIVPVMVWTLRQRSMLPNAAPSERWGAMDRTQRCMLLLMGLVMGLVAVTALLSAPNTWDAMEYHMPRVVEWIGHQSVRLYPTIDRQQLSMPPFSEYAILHLQLLSGGDRFANMVQWMALAGCALVASLIARELGGNLHAQLISAVASATIETGILGASGAKNDYVLAYWISVAVLLLLQWRERRDWVLTLGIGISLSLAVFSKGTAYAFLPPMVLGCFLIWNWNARRLFVLRLPILMVIFLMVNGPLWSRNFSFSGSVLGLPYFDGAGPIEGRMFGNGHITPARSLANIIRNIGSNLATPSVKINGMTTRVLSASIHALGVDPNDYYQLTHSQSGPLPPFDIEWNPGSETQSGNQLHFLLLAAAGILFVWNYRKFDKAMLIFVLGIVGSFALFATLVRWSPWNARYQLPVFVLGAAFMAVVLVRLLPRWATDTVVFGLLLIASVLSTMNRSRPLINRQYSLLFSPRERTYFFDFHRDFADSFIQAGKSVAGEDCQSIGIDASHMHFEYPMMALVNNSGGSKRFSYVAVHNSTTRYKDGRDGEPCTVVCLKCARFPEEQQEYSRQFRNSNTYGEIVVFSNPLLSARSGALDGQSN